MKKSIFILLVIISIFVAACAPQLTVTPQATVTLTPPPAATVIPTPTLHPQFIALQDQIAASGERFTLNSDGTVQDGATTIPGLHFAPDGKVTITVDGEPVEIDPSIMKFDDENGLSIEGFNDADGDGDWEEAISEAMQETNKLIETYGLADEVAEGKITVTEEGGVVTVIDNETGKVMMQSSEDGLLQGIEFATKIAANSCESTPYKPSPGGMIVPNKDYSPTPSEYFTSLINRELGYRSESGYYYGILLDREKQCWASTDGAYFFYRDKDRVAQQVPLIPMTFEELQEFAFTPR